MSCHTHSPDCVYAQTSPRPYRSVPRARRGRSSSHTRRSVTSPQGKGEWRARSKSDIALFSVRTFARMPARASRIRLHQVTPLHIEISTPICAPHGAIEDGGSALQPAVSALSLYQFTQDAANGRGRRLGTFCGCLPRADNPSPLSTALSEKLSRAGASRRSYPLFTSQPPHTARCTVSISICPSRPKRVEQHPHARAALAVTASPTERVRGTHLHLGPCPQRGSALPRHGDAPRCALSSPCMRRLPSPSEGALVPPLVPRAPGQTEGEKVFFICVWWYAVDSVRASPARSGPDA